MYEKTPTFAEDRDDAYFNSICPPEKVEAIRTSAQTAHDATFPARMSRWEARYEKRVKDAARAVAQSDRMELLTGLVAKAESIVDSDEDWVDGASEAYDVVEYRTYLDAATNMMKVAEIHPFQTTPEVAQYGGMQTTIKTAVSKHHDGTTVGPFYYTLEAGNPFRLVPLVETKLVQANHTAATIREGMHDEEFRHLRNKTALLNGEQDGTVLMRWNQPDDVLDELDDIEGLHDGPQLRSNAGGSGDRGMWNERMTAFREAELRRLLREYFGASDYMNREIVLKWEPNPDRPGKFRPAEKMLVREWVTQQLEAKDSRLAAFASCSGTLRQKINRRRAKVEGPVWNYTKLEVEA